MRPVIRPVRPTAPPPPPTPPRRSSGIRQAVVNEEPQVPTTAFKEPVTVTAARHQRPSGTPLRADNDDTPRRYEALPRYKNDETATHERPRKDVRYDGRREDPLNVAYESLPSLERARPADRYERQFSERTPNDPYGRGKRVTRDAYDDGDETSGEQYAPRKGARSDAYASVEDSGPRRRLREGSEPVTQNGPLGYEASYRGVLQENVAPFDSQLARNREPGNAHDERSAPYNSPQIPVSPRVPHDMGVPSGFVMGVQALRNSEPPPAGYTGTQRSGGTSGNHMKVRTPVMGVPYGSPLPQPGIGFSSRVHAPPGQMRIRPPSAAPRSHPVGHQLQVTELEEQQGSKVGRFAWFVFGAAFGIFFAFFATGFVGLGKKDDLAFPIPAELPPETQGAPAATSSTVLPTAPRPLPTQAAPVQTVAAPNQAPAATAPAPSAAPQQPTFAPQPAATAQPAPAPPPPAVTTPQPAASKQEPSASTTPASRPQRSTNPAPPPRGQRAPLMARRGGAPASSAPKAMPNSGSVDSQSSSKSSGKESDVSNIGDLLSAGLAP